MKINFNPVAIMHRMTSPAILCMIQSAYKYSTVLNKFNETAGYITIGFYRRGLTISQHCQA